MVGMGERGFPNCCISSDCLPPPPSRPPPLPLPLPTSTDVPPLEHLPVRTVLDLNLIAQYLINTGENAGGFAVQDVSY